MSEVYAIPPFNRWFLITIWMETLVYVAFYSSEPSTCSFVVNKGRESSELSSLYFITPTHPEYVAKLVLYTTTVFAQDLIIIWRLWVLSGRSWKVVAVPLIIEGAHLNFLGYPAAGYICCARAALGKTFADPVTHDATLITWVLDLAMNVGVTSLIAFKLYITGSRVNMSGLTKGNKYLSSIYTVIESGLIFASAIVVMVGMFLASNNAVVAAADVVAQLAVSYSVRIGFNMTHGTSANDLSASSKTTSANGRSVLDRTGVVHIKTSLEYELSGYPGAKDKGFA
ncbi:hypothetical protein H0H92_005858 [Tricholoma furcatifolium]|nr:hypothetical protein H0H92_005858 [Tricholoma furcatifolium]